jgi:hypothetical protein
VRLRPPRPRLLEVDDSTPVICVEAYRPAHVSALIPKGTYSTLGDARVRAHPEQWTIAIPVSELDLGGTRSG